MTSNRYDRDKPFPPTLEEDSALEMKMTSELRPGELRT